MKDDISIQLQGIDPKTAFEAYADIILDLQLHGPQGVVPIAADSTLRYLSTISTSSIPLCLIAGAPFEVYSEHAATCEWLLEILAHGQTETVRNPEPWWDRQLTQSPVGYLLGIEDKEGRHNGSQTRLTELLLYATTAEQRGAEADLPTPPPSSPRAIDGPEGPSQGNAHSAPPIVFRALPICSSLPRLGGQNAGLLNADRNPRPNIIDLQPSQVQTDLKNGKRRALTTVFDEASQQRKRLKRRGGEAVGTFVREPETFKPGTAQYSQSIDRASTVVGSDNGSSERVIARPTSSRHSRSSSTTPFATEVSSKPHIQLLNQAHIPHDIPESQNAAVVNLKITSEHIEHQNKALLSRTVMAGMRLHGLQQPRKSIQRTTSLPETISKAPPSDDSANEEYRQIYHHTFKAANFALRHQMHARTLKGDDVRETVDRLLGIFLPGTAGIGYHAGDLREGFG